MSITIYNRENPMSSVTINEATIGPTHDGKTFETFKDYATWALGREPASGDIGKFYVEHEDFQNSIGFIRCDSVISRLDDSKRRVRDVYQTCRNTFQDILDTKNHEEQQKNMLAAGEQLIVDLESHVWSDSLDDDTKKEYAIRIMKVISGLLE